MLFSVVVLLPLSEPGLFVVVVVLDSVDFCVTSGEGATVPGETSAPGEAGASVVDVVVVVSFSVCLQPVLVVPNTNEIAAIAIKEGALFKILM